MSAPASRWCWLCSRPFDRGDERLPMVTGDGHQVEVHAACLADADTVLVVDDPGPIAAAVAGLAERGA